MVISLASPMVFNLTHISLLAVHWLDLLYQSNQQIVQGPPRRQRGKSNPLLWATFVHLKGVPIQLGSYASCYPLAIGTTFPPMSWLICNIGLSLASSPRDMLAVSKVLENSTVGGCWNSQVGEILDSQSLPSQDLRSISRIRNGAPQALVVR